MDQFKVLPATPDLQKLVRSEAQTVSLAIKEGITKEKLFPVHNEIFTQFKLDYGYGIVQEAEGESKVHLQTLKYGPYRLLGYLTVPEDSVCTFIPLKNAGGSEASSTKVWWSRVGLEEAVPIIWQIESPLRIPACFKLYVEDSDVRFLMERYVFQSQPAADSDKKQETQSAADGDEK